ncbi:MAG: aspartate 1-decarboxylase [Cyanobacteria bacterium P01_F01_bin.42]
MHRTFLASKLHSCTLTGANLNYIGSISIDEALLQAAQISAYEQVQIVNMNNGARLMTYAIKAPANSGTIELNGAAARLGAPGDRIIVMTYAQLSNDEAASHEPKVVFLDEHNRVVDVRRDLIFHMA